MGFRKRRVTPNTLPPKPLGVVIGVYLIVGIMILSLLSLALASLFTL